MCIDITEYDRHEKNRRRLAREARREGTEFRPISKAEARLAERLSSAFAAMEMEDYEGIGED